MGRGENLKVRNIPLILDEGNERFKEEYTEIKVESVLKAEEELSFEIQEVRDIRVGNEIKFRDKVYVVTRTDEYKDEDGTRTEIESLTKNINLSERMWVGKIDLRSRNIKGTVNRILKGTGWTVGRVDDLGKPRVINIDDKDRTITALLDMVTKVSGHEIEFDTVNNKVNLVKRIGKNLEERITFDNGIKSITRTMEAPEMTVIYPYGKDGLTIKSGNNGKEYLEDFRWYTDVLGMSINEAREKYTKVRVWEDDRFLHVPHLIESAREKLDVLAHPQITYQTTLEYIGVDVELGDTLIVYDKDLGIDVDVRVSRIVDKSLMGDDIEIELDYLDINDLMGFSGGGMDSESSGGSGYSVAVAQNKEDIVLEGNEDKFKKIVEILFSTREQNNITTNLYVITEAENESTLELYIDFEGERKTRIFRQTLAAGYKGTISASPVILGIEGGDYVVNLKGRVRGGSVTILSGEAEISLNGSEFNTYVDMDWGSDNNWGVDNWGNSDWDDDGEWDDNYWDNYNWDTGEWDEMREYIEDVKDYSGNSACWSVEEYSDGSVGLLSYGWQTGGSDDTPVCGDFNGMERIVLPRKYWGKDIDSLGQPVGYFSIVSDREHIKELIIPEGYKYIYSFDFSGNRIYGNTFVREIDRLELPESIEDVDGFFEYSYNGSRGYNVKELIIKSKKIEYGLSNRNSFEGFILTAKNNRDVEYVIRAYEGTETAEKIQEFEDKHDISVFKPL